MEGGWCVGGRGVDCCGCGLGVSDAMSARELPEAIVERAAWELATTHRGPTAQPSTWERQAVRVVLSAAMNPVFGPAHLVVAGASEREYEVVAVTSTDRDTVMTRSCGSADTVLPLWSWQPFPRQGAYKLQITGPMGEGPAERVLIQENGLAVRGVDGTSARAWPAGSRMALVLGVQRAVERPSGGILSRAWRAARGVAADLSRRT